MPERKYFTLFVDYDQSGNFEPVFGDYDREVVLQEMHDMYDSGASGSRKEDYHISTDYSPMDY